MTLAELLEAATPGEWKLTGPEWDLGKEWWHVYAGEDALGATYLPEHDARLIALAPDLARLALDNVAKVDEWIEAEEHLAAKATGTDALVHDYAVDALRALRIELVARLDGIAGKDETT